MTLIRIGIKCSKSIKLKINKHFNDINIYDIQSLMKSKKINGRIHGWTLIYES